MSFVSNYYNSIKVNYAPIPGQIKQVAQDYNKYKAEAFSREETGKAVCALGLKTIGAFSFTLSAFAFKVTLGATTLGGGAFWLALGILGLAVAHDMGELSRNLGFESTPDPRETIIEKAKQGFEKVKNEGFAQAWKNAENQITKSAAHWVAKFQSPRTITLKDIEDLTYNTYIFQATLDFAKFTYENAAKTITQIIPPPHCSRLEGNFELPK